MAGKQTAQEKVIQHLARTNGRLRRWPGGYWSTEQIPPNYRQGDLPASWVGTRTVRALHAAGRIRPILELTDWNKQHFELVRP